MHAYGFGDVLALTGATRSQLIHWTSAKVITARIRDVQGTGHHRVFSLRDVVDVAVAVAMARYGLSVKSIGGVLGGLSRQWRKATREPDTLMFITGSPSTPSAFWFGSRREFAAELGGRGLLTAFVGVLIDLGQIVETLEQATGEPIRKRTTPPVVHPAVKASPRRRIRS